MLIIDTRDSDSLDKALKKYKRKFERAGTIKELRRRQYFTKPSVLRRQELLKAEYKQATYGNQG
jgi:small subunit ribosomal protein S21